MTESPPDSAAGRDQTPVELRWLTLREPFDPIVRPELAAAISARPSLNHLDVPAAQQWSDGVTIAARAVASWAAARQAPHNDPVHAGLKAIARRTPDPAHPRQRRALLQALDQFAAEQERNGPGHCHTIASTLTVAALLTHLPDRWLAGAFYRAAASHTDPVPADQHLWDTLNMITIYDALADHQRAHRIAHDLVTGLIANRGYLDPVTIASCLTWAHLHPSPHQPTNLDGVKSVAIYGLNRLPQPMLRAALTGLARLPVGPAGTPCPARRDGLTRPTSRWYPMNRTRL